MKLIVIGGGPAGMAAACTAAECGVEQVVLMERQEYLGGVLPQCIHNGFGTKLYGRDYTGGEYAWIWRERTMESGVDVRLSTTVLSIEKSGSRWKVRSVGAGEGAAETEADAVIAASGCRERTLPQMMIPGSRPAGIFTAGSAQLMMNVKNCLPGRSAVILGSGDIGLIMARRMTLEGIKVRLVLGQEASGLARNVVQCVKDYSIPMRYGWTVVSTHGYGRLKGVSVAPFGGDGKPDLKKKEYIPCDTLLVAAGLISEMEACSGYEPGRDEGLFVCGNAGRVCDLVDKVTVDAERTGMKAAAYLGKDVEIPEEAEDRREPSGHRGSMVCTVCPEGCLMDVDPATLEVTGNSCARGRDFALREIESPERVVTAVAGTGDPRQPLLSVRTDRPVPKKDVFRVMKAVSKIRVTGETFPGDTVAVDVAGTGADLKATWYFKPVV